MFKILKCLTMLVAMTFLFAGCASVPEPSDKNTSLLYGNVEFNFTCVPNNYGIPLSSTEKAGITVWFQNIKTKKIIKLTTNAKGEILRSNVPEGTYIIHSLSKTINYGAGYKAEYIAKFDQHKTTNFHFIPVDDSVVNLGLISLDISITDIGYYNWFVNWDYEFERVKANFLYLHRESGWLDKEWLTRRESLERNLTLFP